MTAKVFPPLRFVMYDSLPIHMHVYVCACMCGMGVRVCARGGIGVTIVCLS